MARVIYLDCFSGAAGDMLLAAFIDAGLPVEALRQALGSLGVDHDVEVTRVVRAGIGATHFKVRDKQHHHHHHLQHLHRPLAQYRRRLRVPLQTIRSPFSANGMGSFVNASHDEHPTRSVRKR